MLLVLPLQLAAQPAALSETLGRMIDAYGGAENLGKLDSMTQQWDLVALRGNRHGSDRRSIGVPGRLLVELTYPEKTETRLLNSEGGFVVFGGRPAVAKAAQTDAMRLQLMRFYSPLALQDRIEHLELSELGGAVVLTLREAGLRVEYHVNRDSWRIEKVVGILAVGAGEMSFVTEYSDFAWVDGVLVHQRENKFAGGINTAVLRLREINVDVAFDEAEFRTPAAVFDPLTAALGDTAPGAGSGLVDPHNPSLRLCTRRELVLPVRPV
jgi:hypothetical protein